ncbi:MAG: NTP transferase domain-containing protein [Chloroflexi bacterium]|jgi:bifunctional UDP-N-acetylglucosamine pyrophosphorylase/glucosamine-1-phosphate N-acetyltransferase|nr:NTP transferase domain-containing protein [Chloroflexota bacterium]
MIQAVILAAGKGSRLYPITETRSKGMAPILGRPIIERVMRRLTRHDIDDFILVVSPDDREIVQHFSRTDIPGQIRFVYQRERLGMAHALRCAAPLIEGDFVLAACDNLVPARDVGRLLARWQEDEQFNALLTLMPVEPERLGSVGIVERDGPWITHIIEKPAPGEAPSNISSVPLYIFSPQILDDLDETPLSPRGEYELQDAIQRLIDEAGRVSGIMIEQRATVTNADDLLAMNLEFLARDHQSPLMTPLEVGAGTRLIMPLYIEAETTIGIDCTIGPNVVIEHGCRIGDGATIRDALLLRGARVPAGATVVNRVVADE